jgi:hypothetical protein
MCGAKRHVRFTPRADMCTATRDVRLSANSGHPNLAEALWRTSDKYRRARQSDDDFGELAGLRVDVD